MRYTAEQLGTMLDTACNLPAGESQVESIREVVRHAEAAGLVDVLIDARLELVDAHIAADAHDAGEVDRIIAAFVGCVQLYSQHAERFDADLEEAFWRQFATLGLVMISMPDYPLDQVRGVIDDMERRCRPERDDLHTVNTLRMQLAGQLGDRAGVEAAAAALAGLRTAEYACPACLALMEVRELARLGLDEQAIVAAGPILSGDIPCDTGAQPAGVLSELIVPYLHTGRLDEARDAHRRAYRLYDSDDLELAAHLRFCALTGNEERGFEIFGSHLPELGVEPRILQEAELAAAAALLLRRLVEAGRGDEVFIWPADEDDPEDEDEEWTLAGLLEDYVKDAVGLAERFDARYGSTYTTTRIRAIIDEQPVCASLPLSPVVASSVAAAPAPLSGDPAALLDEAEAALREMDQRRLDGALAALAPASDLDPLTAARRAELDARLTWDAPDHDDRLRAVVDAYTNLGQDARALTARSRLGWWLCERGRAEEGLPLLASAAAGLGLDPGAVCEAELRHGMALGRLGDRDGALAALDRAAAALAGLPEGRDRLIRQGRVHEERWRVSADGLDLAREAYRAADAGALLANLCLAAAADDPSSAVPAYQEATGYAAAAPAAAAVAHAELGRLALADDRPADAVPHLVEAVAAFTALSDPRAPYARLHLATAYLGVDRPLDAAECAEEALPALVSPDDRSGAAMQARWVLVRAYPHLRQETKALDVIGSMLEREDDPAAVARLHREAAGILSSLSDEAGAADRFTAAADACGLAGDPFGEVECRRFAALATSYAGLDAAAVLAGADAAADRLPADVERTAWERAMLDHDAAVILDGEDRPAEAAIRAERALERFRSIGDDESADRAAELLANLKDSR